jgi:flagellar basal body-associated protein FliL
MDTFRKIIAGICAVLFVISAVFALFAFNIESKAFNSTTYQKAFEKQNLYERMPEILANALHTSI